MANHVKPELCLNQTSLSVGSVGQFKRQTQWKLSRRFAICSGSASSQILFVLVGVLSLTVKSVTSLTCSGRGRSMLSSVYSNLIRLSLKYISSKGIFHWNTVILRLYISQEFGWFSVVLWLLRLGTICSRKFYLHGVTTWRHDTQPFIWKFILISP